MRIAFRRLLSGKDKQAVCVAHDAELSETLTDSTLSGRVTEPQSRKEQMGKRNHPGG